MYLCLCVCVDVYVNTSILAYDCRKILKNDTAVLADHLFQIC